MTADYFDARMVNRSRLLWAVATRRQLDRWEPYVAESAIRSYQQGELDSADIWAAELEHHFTLIAARHLMRALELKPVAAVAVDPTMRAELIEGRDLHEHWVDNLPVFNVTPRPAQPPRRSGRDFAARNPDHSPYWWLGWSGAGGAMLLPNVPAPALRRLLDDIEAEVLTADPSFATFVPPLIPSRWFEEDGHWWPAADVS
ncbi:MAG: hypothetical protein QOH73_2108 [Gaiellaceae bacterium]|nr:hypothetical protein [Gaiellaceae bacterium]